MRLTVIYGDYNGCCPDKQATYVDRLDTGLLMDVPGTPIVLQVAFRLSCMLSCMP